MARPLIPIDAEQVFKLAQIGCKNQEIADYFNCSAQTIESRFQSELDKGRSELKMSLRRWQIASAQKGNVAMMIWLGKQLLGQRDSIDLVLSKIPDEQFMEEAQRRLEEQKQIAGESSGVIETVRADQDSAEGNI